MESSNLRGVGTALITPFRNEKIDAVALKKIISYNVSNDVDFLVPLGTTGETSTLTGDECKKILDIVKESTDTSIPIVCGMFAKNNTREVIQSIKNADLSGLHSLLLASPSYTKPSQAGLLAHFTAIADASPLPIVLYNVPSRTSVNINSETTLALAEHENIIAVKEASGNFDLIMQLCKYKPADFNVLSGDDAITLPMIACGAVGVISVISNAFPAIFSKYIHAALNQDFGTAKLESDKLLDIHKWLYIEGNPVGVKACLSMMGMCTDDLRLPLVRLSEKNKQSLQSAIAGVL